MRISLNYKDHPITFIAADKTVYMNGTELSKLLGYPVGVYLSRGATKELIEEVAKANPEVPQLITEKPYGDNAGTWIHKDIALNYVGLKSPELKTWISNQVLEMLPMRKARKAAKPKVVKATKMPVVKLSYQIFYEIKNCYSA